MLVLMIAVTAVFIPVIYFVLNRKDRGSYRAFGNAYRASRQRESSDKVIHPAFQLDPPPGGNRKDDSHS